jgi:hypothetical protein
MLETNTQNWEKEVFEKGKKQGIEIGVEKVSEKKEIEITSKMIENNMSNADIHKITGLYLSARIRREMKKR